MHTVRVLKEHGTLDLLKGLIQDEGSCAMTGGGLALTAADFVNVPYLAFKSDYSVRGPAGDSDDPVCQATVNAIKAAGGKADYIQLDQPGCGKVAMLVRSGMITLAPSPAPLICT